MKKLQIIQKNMGRALDSTVRVCPEEDGQEWLWSATKPEFNLSGTLKSRLAGRLLVVEKVKHHFRLRKI